MSRWRDFRRAMAAELLLARIRDGVGGSAACDSPADEVTECQGVVTVLKISCERSENAAGL